MPNPGPLTELNLLPGPKMLEAIGRVAVEWGALEAELDRVLFWASDPNDTTAEDILKNGPVRKRCELLKDILEREHADHPGTAELISVIDDALSLKGERDRIIHNDYALPDGDAPHDPDPSRLMLSAWRSRKKSQDWCVNHARIKATAKKINAVLLREANLQFQCCERLGNSIRLNAWRHKSRKQD